MNENKNLDEKIDENADYIGNIWGWKFSTVALIVIALMVIWMMMRDHDMKKQMNSPTQQTEQSQ